jgi:DNA-binding FrmR family transcriptional regulator
MKIKVKELLGQLNSVNKQIDEYWSYIKNENIVPKWGPLSVREHNLTNLLYEIENLGNKRINIKLDQLAANLHFKSRSELINQPWFTDSIYPIVFRLSELNAQRWHLNGVHTLDFTDWDKMTKTQKNKNMKTEEFSAKFINNRIKDIDGQINNLKAKLEDYNSTNEYDIDVAFHFEDYAYDQTFGIAA